MSHAHLPFTLPCLGPRLPPAPNLWLLLLLFQIAWSLVLLWLREAQRWWSRKLTRQLLLWLRLLFVERVQKWRSPRTYWKNRENVLASANEIQAIFLLIPHTTGRPPSASGGRCWSSLEQVNNYYHGRKVSNYCKSFHKEIVLAINASGLLCRRRGAIKMLIELDLNIRWSSEVVMGTSSVANETIKNYGVTLNKAEGLRKLFCVINPIRVNISRPKKNLDLSSGNICKLEH